MSTPLMSPSLGLARWRVACVLIMLGIATLEAGFVAHSRLSGDESQHLHAAWLVAHGRVPYADFWEHHTPLLYYALAPLTRWFAETPAVYFAGRAIMAAISVGSLALVYALARRLGTEVGVLAVVLLVVQYRFLQDSTQVRPDVPALLTWLATVLALVRWRESEIGHWLWVAGLGLGVAATLTPKAAYVGLGAAGAVIAATWRPRALAKIGLALARLAGGCAIPVSALVVWLAYIGGAHAMRAFIEDIVMANLRFPDFRKLPPLGIDGAGFMVLGLIGMALSIRRHGGHVLRHPVHGPVLIPVVTVSLILLLPTTPAVYGHTWLPVIACGSIYAGVACAVALERLRTAGGRRAAAAVALTVVAGILVPLAVSSDRAFRHNPGNDTRLARMRTELAYACAGEAVLDGTALYVFRPSALRYHDLGTGLRIWLARDVTLQRALVDDLRRAQAPVGFFSWRLVQAGAPVTAFVDTHYVQESAGLLLAGVRLLAPGGAGQTDVDLLVPGLYRTTLSPGLHAAVDAAEVKSPVVKLAAGPHRISWSGGPGTIRLAIAPCAERRG